MVMDMTREKAELAVRWQLGVMKMAVKGFGWDYLELGRERMTIRLRWWCWLLGGLAHLVIWKTAKGAVKSTMPVGAQLDIWVL